MHITRIIGREIYDSRGLPTIECELTLSNKSSVRASVPSGASRSKHEAVDLRDGGKRLMGLGVTNAIENLEQIIAPLLIGKEPNFIEMDALMLAADGTPNKSKLGGNTILAASIAITKAQAQSLNMPLYEFVAHACNFDAVSIPYPMFNMINGGKHADNNLPIQEIMLVPMGFTTFKDAMAAAVTVQHQLGALLHAQGKRRYVGDEGGFCADFADEKEALDLLLDAVDKAGYNTEEFKIAIDVAASQLYDYTTGLYRWSKKNMNTEELINYYSDLVSHYPIYSLEDGLEEDDWESWIILTKEIGNKIQIVGDDLFATNCERIAIGIEQKAATAAIIKPNQTGTLTETLQAILLCKDMKMNTIVSHRSGETEDTFIIDLAVGTNAGQLKAGGCQRGERMSKYNQLLRIEDRLHRSIMNQ